VDIDNGELELPEELPEFPYEKEMSEEIQETIVRYGGREGATMLKSQASEQLEAMNENQMIDSTVERLNQMIQEFENLGAVTSGKSKLSYKDKMILNVVLREVFVNRFVSMFHSFEHFVIINDEQDLNMTRRATRPFIPQEDVSYFELQKQVHELETMPNAPIRPARFNAEEFLSIDQLPPPKKIQPKAEPEPERPRPLVTRQVGIADQIAIRSYVLAKSAGKAGAE